MQSYYFYEVGVALPPVIAAFFSGGLVLFLLLFHTQKIKATLVDGYRAFIFTFILVFLSLLDIIILNVDVLYPRFFATLMFVSVLIHFLYLQMFNAKILASALKASVVTHLLFFWIQVFSYYLGFGFLDFIEPITGEVQRSFGGQYSIELLGGGFIRGAGLYNEPGTFATFLFVLYLLYKSAIQHASNDLTFGVFDFFVMLTTALSFSVFGLVFAAIYILFICIVLWRRLMIYFPFLVFIGFLIFESYLYPRFFGASGGGYDSGLGFRAEGVDVYIEKVLEFPYLLFGGVGLFSDINLYFNSYIVWNDLGLAFYFLVTVGLIGCFGFLIIFLFGFRGLKYHDSLLLLIMLISKISPAMMLFWLCVAVLYSNRKGRYEVQRRCAAVT